MTVRRPALVRDRSRPSPPVGRGAARGRRGRPAGPDDQAARARSGRVEDLAVALAGIAGACPPPLPEPAAVAVFAADHGVHAQGVTPWPQEVTAQMVANFLRRRSGGQRVRPPASAPQVRVVDVGVAGAAGPGARPASPRRVAAGTADLTDGPALTREQAQRRGRGRHRDGAPSWWPPGTAACVTGDMGIANTTAAAALICAFTGADPAAATGRGTGIDDATLARKIDVVRRGAGPAPPRPGRPDRRAGRVRRAGARRAGRASCSARAALPRPGAARRRQRRRRRAGRRGAGPGRASATAWPGTAPPSPATASPWSTSAWHPLLDLGMRLGEGTGALLALPVVQSAAQALHDVATFDAAGVTRASDADPV